MQGTAYYKFTNDQRITRLFEVHNKASRVAKLAYAFAQYLSWLLVRDVVDRKAHRSNFFLFLIKYNRRLGEMVFRYFTNLFRAERNIFYCLIILVILPV